MRRICGKFKYRSNDPAEVSLLNDSHHVCNIMAQLLEKRVSQAGIKIHRMDFTELSYAPGVASGLLQVQQAQARVDARKVIVQGAVEITHDAIKLLNEASIELDQQDIGELTSNLMQITCADDSHQGAVMTGILS